MEELTVAEVRFVARARGGLGFRETKETIRQNSATELWLPVWRARVFVLEGFAGFPPGFVRALGPTTLHSVAGGGPELS